MSRPALAFPSPARGTADRSRAFSLPARAPRPRLLGFSGTLTVELADGGAARQAVEAILRREAIRVEVDALHARADGATARYEVLFTERARREGIAWTLLKEARPLIRSAVLT